MGEAITGDGKWTDEEKIKGSASTLREVLSNFSAVLAPLAGGVA